MSGDMTFEEHDRLQERRNELAKEVFGHPGVGYSSMKPYVKAFIDRMIAYENAVDAALALAAEMKMQPATEIGTIRGVGAILQTTVEKALES